MARARLSLRTALALVFAFATTVLVLEIAHDSRRVIAWVLSAAAVAALLAPAVAALQRFMSRGLAVLVVFLLVTGFVGFVAYRIVDDVADETRRLQELAPERAAELERDSELLREIELTDRVERFVERIPERLRGGTTAEAIRSAANRSLAFVAGLILTLFFVLYGRSLVDGALGQIRDARRRETATRVVAGASRRGLGYARAKAGEVVVEGLVAFAIARAADVPGPAALAVWVALWTLIPVVGVLIGAVPIVAFAGAESTGRAVAVALAFAAMAVGEWFVTREIERRTVHVGGFLTALLLFAGLELYGFMGALLLLLGGILAVAVVAELGPEEVAEVLADGLDGPDPAAPAAAPALAPRSWWRRAATRRPG